VISRWGSLLVLAVLACGGERDAPGNTSGTTAERPPIPERPDDFAGIGVALTGQAIRADQATTPAGRAAFSVTNAGRETYILIVQGPGVNARTEPIPPGGTALIDVQLSPGTYELRTEPEQASPVPAAARTTLTVTG
jgi:hypothetical protein